MAFLRHKKSHFDKIKVAFTFTISSLGQDCNYQLALRKPGTLPSIACSRNLLRHRPNLR